MAQLKRQGLPSEVRAILAATGQDVPEDAIRRLARDLLNEFSRSFPDAVPPHNMEALASFRSIRLTPGKPLFSEDAELAPDGKGGVIMRINSERPRTRQRFSIGHEIGHTLFPGYQSETHCRKTQNRDWADSKDLIEYLCDVAASEFLFPEPWFHDDAKSVNGSAELIALAQKYQASPDATARRFIEVRNDPQAVIFFRWKLKPTERRRADDPKQHYMFGSRAAFEPQRKLRVEYSISNPAFDELGHHIPADKSIDDQSVVSRASAEAECLDALEALDLGPLHGRFSVRAFPIFTSNSDLGPAGERSVAALVSPATPKQRAKTRRPR